MSNITAKMVPITVINTKGEFCPVNIGMPRRISTTLKTHHSFPTALLYDFTSSIGTCFKFDQNPTGSFDLKADIPIPKKSKQHNT